MSRTYLSYILTFLFVISITTPSFISYSDLNYELTELLDLGEEEENKGKESSLDLEFKILSSNGFMMELESSTKLKNGSFYSDHYQNDFVKTISHPPEDLS